MRSVTSRFDPNRKRGNEDVRSKFIFVFEGYSTEVAYSKVSPITEGLQE
jgi:hypothetical protein